MNEDEDGLVADVEDSSLECGGVRISELVVLQLEGDMSALCTSKPRVETFNVSNIHLAAQAVPWIDVKTRNTCNAWTSAGLPPRYKGLDLAPD